MLHLFAIADFLESAIPVLMVLSYLRASHGGVLSDVVQGNLKPLAQIRVNWAHHTSS